MTTLTQHRFHSLSLIVFSHTYMISFVSKQGHATKVFMQMAPPLKLSFLGCSRFRKLIQPLPITLLSPGLG